MKVLLVEDDPSLREGMGEVIAELAEVRTVGSVDSALAALREERFDLVLTDLRIAGATHGGRTILEAARQRLQPVAIISASAAEEVAKVLRPFEPDAMLAKPFQLEDMVALVERFLALRGDVERLSKARPPEASWAQASAGVQVAPFAATPMARTPVWVRMQPGASFSWALQLGRQGVLLLEGDLEVEGERRTAPHYLFLPAGQPREVRTREGCLALSLALPG